MKDVIIDVEKIKDPYSGLGQFCLNLSNALLKHNETLDFGLYCPGRFKYLHRTFSHLLPKAKIWHAMHQEAPYISNRGELILTIHDMNYMYKDRPNFLKQRFLSQMKKKIERASHIAFISHFAQKATLQYFDLSPDKMSVIYNGVAHSEHTVRPSRLLPENFFLTIGHVLPKKNFHVLVDLMELRDEALIIVGNDSSSYAKMIHKRIEEKKLQSRVLLLGNINDGEKNWLLKHCRAFLFPSLFEGFGIPVVESMAWGRPTFSSTQTSLPEVCGEHAYYFNSFDPHEMDQVISKGLENFNQERAQACKRWAQRYDWNKAAQSYLEIYHSMI